MSYLSEELLILLCMFRGKNKLSKKNIEKKLFALVGVLMVKLSHSEQLVGLSHSETGI
jgi:hypothetical protein